MTTCDPSPGWNPATTFPYPPVNVQVVSPLTTGCLDIRWDDPSTLNTGPASLLVTATGALVLTGVPAPLRAATATLTLLGSPVAPGARITIGGIDLVSVAGPRTPGGHDFNGSLATATLIAQDIADAINDAANTYEILVSATASGGVVTLTAKAAGAAGNLVTLTTDSPLVMLSGSTLLNGTDADLIQIGGNYTLTAVTGARTPGNNDFSVDGSTFDIAQSIADAINDPANNFTSLVTAEANSGRVTLLAVLPGVQGNTIWVGTTSSVIVLEGLSSNGFLQGGSGIVECTGRSNSQWEIVGVNIYRSDEGERGPYYRINDFPVGIQFYRDCTDNIRIETEVVDWDWGWLFKGDAPNDRRWVFRTRQRPIVKKDGPAVAANAPSDVVVTIDGVVVPVDSVFGPTGEIKLINIPTWDLARQLRIDPLLPNPDGSSTVTVTYYWNRNLVDGRLDHRRQIFYRVTTVAIDPSTPSGLVETPLEYAPPVSVMEVETLDYIWREAIKRNNWILEQGGERVKLFIRKQKGVRCTCGWDPRMFEYYKQPKADCELCFGTGWVGGYEGPYDIIVAPEDAERRIEQTPNGRHLNFQYEVWTGPSPVITQRDFLVKQTGERFSIGPVHTVTARGAPLQQSFTIAYLDECDIRYRLGIGGLAELPWPETRYTLERTACNDAPPYPVGADYQATPMETEAANIDDGREQRGRTPVWQHITYGSGGGGS